MLKLPENDNRFTWTRHSKNKMLFYNISKAQIIRILKQPDRIEEGIAEDTIGAMKVQKSFGKIKKESEMWIMYQMKTISAKESRFGLPTKKITMISAWRYPGRTKPGDKIPIPEDIAEELRKGIY